VKTPPSSGPAIEAIPYIAPMMPVKTGLFSNGTLYAIITNAPLKIPAEPTPAIARPTISATDEGAAPHSALPISKMKIETRKTVLILKNVYSFPKNNCSAQVVNR
jgi:hypothetical protein